MADVSTFAPRCRHGHVLARYVLVPCDLHANHAIYTCHLRRGSKPCGEVEVLPPWTPSCNEDDDEA